MGKFHHKRWIQKKNCPFIFTKFDECDIIISTFNFFSPNFATCNCNDDGNVTDFKLDEGLWCCRKENSENCIVGKRVIGARGAYVTSVNCTGKALKLSQQCHNNNTTAKHCNFYASDYSIVKDSNADLGVIFRSLQNSPITKAVCTKISKNFFCIFGKILIFLRENKEA